MRRFFTGLCTVLASVLLILAALIISIEMFAINPGFFEKEYDKLGTAQSIGVSSEDLSTVTNNLLDYTIGSRENLDMQVSIGGEMQEVFGQREKDHMIDVKALYLAVRDFRTFSLIGAGILIIIAFMLSRKRAILSLCRSFLYVSGGFLVAVAALGIYAVADFTSFWTSFHHVFFTNDLWILDPRTDVLIMMVPEQFFFDLVTRIIIRFVSIFAALNIAAFVGKRWYKNNALV